MKYFKLIDNERFLLEGSFWVWSPLDHLALRRAVSVYYGKLCDFNFQLNITIALFIVSFNVNFIVFRKDNEDDN